MKPYRRRALLAELVRAGHSLSTTTLNIAELYAGMRAGEAVATEAFLNGLESYELSGGSIRFHENYARSTRKVKQPAVVLFTWR